MSIGKAVVCVKEVTCTLGSHSDDRGCNFLKAASDFEGISGDLGTESVIKYKIGHTTIYKIGKHEKERFDSGNRM